jgi:predicted small secreted protein
MIRKALLLFFAVVALVTASTGCRTAHGAGEDIEHAGQSIQDKTDQ